MQRLTKQQGFTVLGLLAGAIVIAFVGLTLMRFLPVYIQHYSIISSVKALSSLPSSVHTGSPATVQKKLKAALLKQLNINEIDIVLPKNIKVFLDADGYQVRVWYDNRIKIVGNIDALIHFDNTILVSDRES